MRFLVLLFLASMAGLLSYFVFELDLTNSMINFGISFLAYPVVNYVLKKNGQHEI